MISRLWYAGTVLLSAFLVGKGVYILSGDIRAASYIGLGWALTFSSLVVVIKAIHDGRA